MRHYQDLGMQLRLKRVESGLHQKTVGVLLGEATQALISWWESGPRYLPKVNQFLSLDPLALRVYVLASGLQQRRGHGRKTKTICVVLKTDQKGERPSRRVNGQQPCPHSGKSPIHYEIPPFLQISPFKLHFALSSIFIQMVRKLRR